MRELSIIIAFLAIVLVACSAKEKDCEKETDSAKSADVLVSEDTPKSVSKDCQEMNARGGALASARRALVMQPARARQDTARRFVIINLTSQKMRVLHCLKM